MCVDFYNKLAGCMGAWEYFFLGAWVDGVGSGPKDSSAAAAISVFFWCQNLILLSKIDFWDMFQILSDFPNSLFLVLER